MVSEMAEKVRHVEFSGRGPFDDATEFANTIARERLINISHSATMGGNFVAVVWYWDEVIETGN